MDSSFFELRGIFQIKKGSEKKVETKKRKKVPEGRTRKLGLIAHTTLEMKVGRSSRPMPFLLIPLAALVFPHHCFSEIPALRKTCCTLEFDPSFVSLFLSRTLFPLPLLFFSQPSVSSRGILTNMAHMSVRQTQLFSLSLSHYSLCTLWLWLGLSPIFGWISFLLFEIYRAAANKHSSKLIFPLLLTKSLFADIFIYLLQFFYRCSEGAESVEIIRCCNDGYPLVYFRDNREANKLLQRETLRFWNVAFT